MMNITSIGGAAILILSCSLAAVAAEQTKGIVTSIDLRTRTLTLQSGETFQFDNPGRLYGFTPGDRIGVSHNGARGINTYNPHPSIRDNIDID
ncbi:hypothetical protein K32_41970 [Kaistia sp. 32K]|uniref:DUF1344 domain-containing protein n=1 Tax=Kaistia sp. 32K TaxID=2795690 RepID=UPI0019165A9A|nr:DUF1344 domain-containing protein [Kaistia sp. 32K]BCP55580.1 hypothetical protein K32_41970 [Kaistia sp. 32K]